MILTANWTCRSGTVVLSKTPAFPPASGDSDAPVASKMSVLTSVAVSGGAKFAWLMILNISTRNCTLKFSEILLMWLFLNTEKSRLLIPGPIMMFRPALPRRLKHCGNVARTGGTPDGFWALGGAGLQFAVQKAMSGALGIAKHCVLM